VASREKALVLGCTGFVGTRVAQILAEKCYDVHNRSLGSGPDLHILDAARDSLAWIQPQFIFNCAAKVGSMKYIGEHPVEIYDDNTRMASNLYRAVADVCDQRVTIINPLSNCSYPGNSSIQKEAEWLDGPPHPSVAPYAYVKRHLYMLSQVYAPKIVTVNFILPNSFGPGDHLDPERTHALSGIIVRMIQAKRLDAPLFKIWGSGAPIREWGYIDDMAELITHGATIDEFGLYKPINLAQNFGYSIMESADTIKRLMRYEGELVFDADKSKDGDPIKILDDARFRKFFPYYKFTDHETALRRTIAYYENALS